MRSFAEASESNADKREHQAFPLEWDNALDRLVDLEAMARHGGLSPATIAELHVVGDELATLIPTMQRHHLRLPDPEVLARARSATAA